LKKVVAEHAQETSTSCEVKASIACGENNTEDCRQCKKSFIVLCVEEDIKRKNELVHLLENCDSFLEDEFQSTSVYQH